MKIVANEEHINVVTKGNTMMIYLKPSLVPAFKIEILDDKMAARLSTTSNISKYLSSIQDIKLSYEMLDEINIENKAENLNSKIKLQNATKKDINTIINKYYSKIDHELMQYLTTVFDEKYKKEDYVWHNTLTILQDKIANSSAESIFEL